MGRWRGKRRHAREIISQPFFEQTMFLTGQTARRPDKPQDLLGRQAATSGVSHNRRVVYSSFFEPFGPRHVLPRHLACWLAGRFSRGG